ncbi:unnamed protein product [Brugia timori]|uniref:Ovule protein n=1 Tax=Brugia timori TaxID=42155 RepID=A0A0R3RA49_9BILA|nr:unnamed protein product [Brugia timori]
MNIQASPKMHVRSHKTYMQRNHPELKYYHLVLNSSVLLRANKFSLLPMHQSVLLLLIGFLLLRLVQYRYK